jgi:monofunctional biosynthetic peptidoglycan transglycosylase
MLRLLSFVVLRILILFFGISLVWVIILKFLPVWFTPYMLSCKIASFKADQDTEIHRDWEPYENISKEVALAVVASAEQVLSLSKSLKMSFCGMAEALSGRVWKRILPS